MSSHEDELQTLKDKITRLEKVNKALMHRVEESVNKGGEAHVLFQNAITLERKVKERTSSLEATREKLEKSNEELIKAKERAEIATVAKSKFLANMSHEIRTPMNGMLGILQLVLENELPEELRTDLNTVYASAHSLLALLNDILDFSKAEADRIELEQLEFDLCTLIEDSLELFSEQAASKKLQLYADIDPNLPGFVLGDPARLRQVINNLVGNAVKFTESGSVVINVKHHLSNGDNVYRIAIIDTGIGISDEQRLLLFKPFSQADVSTTRKYGGTGLGLAICSQIVECMGGRIQIESQPGVGSEFSFEIPLAAMDVNRHLSPLKKSNAKHLALLDTHEGHAQAIANKLIQSGYKVSFYIPKTPNEFVTIQEEIKACDAVLVDAALFEILTQENLKAIDNIVPVMAHRQQIKNAERYTSPLFKPIRRREVERVLNKIFDPESEDSTTTAYSSTTYQLADDIQTKILVVDDNEVNQIVAERSLQRLGYKADVVANGIDAVEAHKNKNYDLIFMDCQMPVMDGYEASRIIRSMKGKASLVPIIALTANVMDGDKSKCLQAGMSDYLGKPVKLEQLKILLKDWIK